MPEFEESMHRDFQLVGNASFDANNMNSCYRVHAYRKSPSGEIQSFNEQVCFTEEYVFFNLKTKDPFPALKSKTFSRAKARIDLGLFKQGESYKDVILTTTEPPDPKTDSQIQFEILSALDLLRKSSPLAYKLEPLEIEGFCDLKGISREHYFYNADLMLEEGWIKEGETDQLEIANGGIYITKDGISALKKLSQPPVPEVEKEERKTSTRISASTPATNYEKIADLIGSASVDAVFDPYLDNKGLTALGNIFSLDISASSSLRLLSGMKPPALTNNFLADWLKEHGISGEMKLMISSEHSRFLLLNNGKSLRIGVSLNGLRNNEAAHLDSNKEDLEFFDSVWKTARPFIEEKITVAQKNPDKEKHAKRILEDWRDWQQEQSYDFKQQTRRGYRKISEKEGIIPALISKLFREFPTLTMIEKRDLATARMRRQITRKLEDLGFSQIEIEKMIEANILA